MIVLQDHPWRDKSRQSFQGEPKAVQHFYCYDMLPSPLGHTYFLLKPVFLAANSYSAWHA